MPKETTNSWVEAARQTFVELVPEDHFVIWLGDFYCTDTRFRVMTIHSNSEWKEFAKSCLLPWYKNGKDWSSPSSGPYRLEDYAKQNPRELTGESEKIVLTVYHSLLRQRVIVDGCKRAVALESEACKSRELPKVKIVECYGSQVHAIFPGEFCNSIVRALDRRPRAN